LGARTLVSAVLDVSSAAIPGKPDPDLLLARAEELAELGADFVDVCALPVRPTGKRISADDELSRIVPTIRKLRAAAALPFFVTTYNSETAARAIELEAAGIHDPSGITIDALDKILTITGVMKEPAHFTWGSSSHKRGGGFIHRWVLTS